MIPGARVWVLLPGRPHGTFVSMRAADDKRRMLLTVDLDRGETVELTGRDVFVLKK